MGSKAESKLQETREALEQLRVRREELSTRAEQLRGSIAEACSALGGAVLEGGNSGTLAGAIAREEQELRGVEAALAAVREASAPLEEAQRLAAIAALQDAETACKRRLAELSAKFQAVREANSALLESYHSWFNLYGSSLAPVLPVEEREAWRTHLSELGRLCAGLERSLFPKWEASRKNVMHNCSWSV